MCKVAYRAGGVDGHECWFQGLTVEQIDIVCFVFEALFSQHESGFCGVVRERVIVQNKHRG